MSEGIVTPAAEEVAPAKKFYGTQAVISAAKSSDGRIIGLLLADNTNVNIPTWELDVLVTETPMDAVTIRNERSNFVAQKILALLLDLDFPINDIEFLNNKVFDSLFGDMMPGSFHRAMNKAVEAATNGNVKRRQDLRMSDVDAMLAE